MQIINGKDIANEILKRCKEKVATLEKRPVLAIIMVGNNPASEEYISRKRIAGEMVGVTVEVHNSTEPNQNALLKTIHELNTRIDVAGIIVQLPVPGLDPFILCSAIAPEKDVDGLNPLNFGHLWLNPTKNIIPATVKAITYILEFIAKEEGKAYEQYIDGKSVLIINSSSIIGKPLAGLLLSQFATITLAHSHTKNLNELISKADIVISGTGKLRFISDQTFKSDSVLIDVGFNKTDGKVHGDADRATLDNNIKWLTPVPGGVGPIGVACLIENTVDAASKNS